MVVRLWDVCGCEVVEMCVVVRLWGCVWLCEILKDGQKD